MSSPVSNATHVAGAATTNITPCKLFKGIIVGSPATGAITVSDGTPGTTITVINSTTAVDPFQIECEIALSTNNLRVVTQASQDVTILWE